MKKLFFVLITSSLIPQENIQYLDGVAAIVENHIILKSDLAQMINMAAIQRRIDPRTNPEIFIHLQNTISKGTDQTPVNYIVKGSEFDVKYLPKTFNLTHFELIGTPGYSIRVFTFLLKTQKFFL